MFFEKKEVQKKTLQYLKGVEATDFQGIITVFERELLKQERIAPKTELSGRVNYNRSETGIPDEDTTLINEVIWDLIIERVVTPGRAGYHDGLPSLTVNKEKLQIALEKLNQ